MEISGDVTDVGRTTNERTREDRATQPNGCWMAEFRKFSPVHHSRWLHSVLGNNMSDVGFGVVVMYTPEYAV